MYRKLFIIDDDAEDQEIFREALKEIDSRITCQGSMSGDEALAFLNVESNGLPDLIFLDMNMPKLNGKQVLKLIRNTERLKAIPVIMYSTSFAPRDIVEVMEIGAVHHLLKPSRFGELCQALQSVLSIKWQVTA